MTSLNNEEKADDTKVIAIFRALVWLTVAGLLGWQIFVNATAPDSQRPFKLGLDLAGGSHLVYEADLTGIDSLEAPALMDTLRTVVERRVNSLGTEENSVYLETSSAVSDTLAYRLVVELPGVTDIATAVAEIGRTPLLEFKLMNPSVATAQQQLIDSLSASTTLDENYDVASAIEAVGTPYIDTGLTGRYLESAVLEFTGGQAGQLAGEPIVSIRFNKEGGDLFASITRENVGERLAIFLDGQMVSSPRINEAITGGTAVISGGFTADEAKELAQNLNLGALPVPIELANTQTIGATLGNEVLERGTYAGVIGLAIVMLFMVAYYRLPGLIASLSLLTYVVVMLSIFQWLPVTLTAAGLAGFILSIGIAVDANVLVFERMKEELQRDLSVSEAVRIGTSRAWSAIRDGNITSIFSAIILFWFGTTMVKGFALVFGLGTIVSMFTAIIGTKTLLLALPHLHSSLNKPSALYFRNKKSQ